MTPRVVVESDSSDSEMEDIENELPTLIKMRKQELEDAYHQLLRAQEETSEFGCDEETSQKMNEVGELYE